jgi:fimbrial chaperone protein
MRLQRKNKAVAPLGIAAVLAALLLWGAAAHALTISPVLVEVSPARRISSITFSNPGDTAISFQTQVLSWTQVDGVDHYEDSDELMVVPPIAQIGAGGSQIFRVTMRAPPNGQERAYRLIFEDVTTAVAPPGPSEEVKISIRVNHNLPVFAAAAGKPRASARLGSCASAAKLTATPATTRCVRLDNDGNHYLQVTSLSFEGATGRKEIVGSARVLAGAWKQWNFEVPGNSSGTVRVMGETSDGRVTFELPVLAR